MTAQTTHRRSDATRAAILSAARERFAAEGYKHATIRAIAHDASIDPAMVMRYYGSKEELFLAAIEVRLGLPDVSDVARSRVGRTLAAFFVERWEGDEVLIALLRTAATNEPIARQRLHEVFDRQIRPMVAKLCTNRAEVPARAALVASQILGLALCRYVLRLEPVVALHPDEIVATVGPTLQRYLTGPLHATSTATRARKRA